MIERCDTGLREEAEDVSVLLPQHGVHCEDALDESAAFRAVCFIGSLAPEHAVPNVQLGRVVRELNAIAIDKNPYRDEVLHKELVCICGIEVHLRGYMSFTRPLTPERAWAGEVGA